MPLSARLAVVAPVRPGSQYRPPMAIQIVPHALEWKDAVEAFNARMRAGGSPYGFYVDPVPLWIPYEEGATVWREYYLAVEDGQHVRAGFGLKPQRWWVRGREETVTDWQGPFSEGAIDPRYGALALRILRDMMKRRPNIYSWGHGGEGEAIVQLIQKMGWQLHGTPLSVRVLRPKAFLQKNAFLRDTSEKRFAADLLAATGAGDVGAHALHLALRARRPRVLVSRTEVIPAWGSWADELWLRHRDAYAALAVRDAAAMNRLVPPDRRQPEWSELVRVRVKRVGGEDAGWAVIAVRQMSAHPRFGDACVGTLVDAFAAPRDAALVVDAATDHMRDLGADVVIANQAHPRWVEGLSAAGWLTMENKRFVALSPGLASTLAPWEETVTGLFLTNLDGHGPMGL